MTQPDPLHDVLEPLSRLAPPDKAVPAAADAWHRFQSETLMQGRSPAASFSLFNPKTWRISTMNLKSVRVASVALVGLLIAALFIFPEARATANQFLGLFRVQKFAPISVSPEALAQLENLELEGIYPGEITWIREPQEPQPVATYDEAAATAGYDRWVFTFEHELGPPSEIAASSGGAAVLTVDLASSRSILDIAGIDPALLPDNLDGAEISVDVPGTIMMGWAGQEIILIQSHSPQVDYPAGFDPAPIGQAMLQLLGMDEIEAYRLSQNIDWTNTLILPIPQEIGTFREVPVFSTTGLLIEALDGSHAAVVWQNDDAVYMASGAISGDALVDLIGQ